MFPTHTGNSVHKNQCIIGSFEKANFGIKDFLNWITGEEGRPRQAAHNKEV